MAKNKAVQEVAVQEAAGKIKLLDRASYTSPNGDIRIQCADGIVRTVTPGKLHKDQLAECIYRGLREIERWRAKACTSKDELPAILGAMFEGLNTGAEFVKMDKPKAGHTERAALEHGIRAMAKATGKRGLNPDIAHEWELPQVRAALNDPRMWQYLPTAYQEAVQAARATGLDAMLADKPTKAKGKVTKATKDTQAA